MVYATNLTYLAMFSSKQKRERNKMEILKIEVKNGVTTTTYQDGTRLVDVNIKGRRRGIYKMPPITEREILIDKLMDIAKEVHNERYYNNDSSLCSELLKIRNAIQGYDSLKEAFDHRLEMIKSDWLWEKEEKAIILRRLNEIYKSLENIGRIAA